MNAGLFSKNGQYRLKVELLKLDQPMFGLDMTVTMTVKYTLLDYKNHNIIFTKIVSKPYTATVSNAFVAITRLRMANEGAVKENIYTFLKKLKN